MPGIVGLVTRAPHASAEAVLQRMIAAMNHDSFLVTRSWCSESQGAYVGWVARGNSVCAGMPLTSQQEDIVLVFSGEEFAEQSSEGRSHLIERYEQDASFPASLNGQFQGFVADEKRDRAMLFNDRYGMHRIYYHEAPDAFYFASEAKAILAVCPELRSIDPRGLGEFVSCGCVLENRTLFKDIHVLPPASAWIFRNGSLELRKQYFRPREWEEQEPLDTESYYEELRDVFSRKLPLYFDGPERIAMSLTGGLDTRKIMAWLKPPPDSLPCFTFGSMYRDCRDVKVARRVAAACQQSHQVIGVGKEFLSHFPDYAERTVYLTDGCAGVSRAADLYVNERVAQIAPVRMTGNYGDEVLRRLRVFRPMETLPGLFAPEFLDHFDEARRTYGAVIEGNPLSFAVFRQAPWYQFGLLALEETQVSVRTPFLDNDLVRTAFRAPASTTENTNIFTNNDLRERLIRDGNPALSMIQTDLGFGGNAGRFSSFLTRKVLEFTFKAEYAYDYGMPQFVARIDHLFAPLHLERLFLGRHKFCHFRVWYRDVLSDYVREMLLDPRTLSRPYLKPKTLESMLHGHLKGNRNYTTVIHTLLTLELIHRRFVDSVPFDR